MVRKPPKPYLALLCAVDAAPVTSFCQCCCSPPKPRPQMVGQPGESTTGGENDTTLLTNVTMKNKPVRGSISATFFFNFVLLYPHVWVSKTVLLYCSAVSGLDVSLGQLTRHAVSTRNTLPMQERIIHLEKIYHDRSQWKRDVSIKRWNFKPAKGFLYRSL